MQIIDVRSREDFDCEHLEGAIHFDVQDLAQGALPDIAKDTPVLVYCTSGGRSSLAKHILESSGFTNVTNGGGYESLKAEIF